MFHCDGAGGGVCGCTFQDGAVPLEGAPVVGEGVLLRNLEREKVLEYGSGCGGPKAEDVEGGVNAGDGDEVGDGVGGEAGFDGFGWRVGIGRSGAAHGVGDVDSGEFMDAGGFEESVVEQVAGLADEGESLYILEVAGVLADTHHSRGTR